MAEEEKETTTMERSDTSKRRKLGGIRTMPFILGNEVCDKFAAAGFHANMITYLTQELNLPLVKASNILTNFGGTSSFTPLIGAFFADSFAGRFWIIIAGSIFYELESGLAAGISSTGTTFAWDWLATLTALTVVVYIQDHVGWGWGLGIPTIAMFLSILAFVFGSSLYNKVKPGGSPLVRLAQVVVAAFKKRKAVVPQDTSLLYQNKELDKEISLDGRLLHTDQYKWLDKAAIVTESDKQPPNLWRIATVHRVEELKCIIRMLPIWASGILLVTSSSHLHSFVIQQARSMDRHLSHSFEIPPASLSIFSILTMLIGLVIYERLFVPFARRFTGNPAGITCLQRMGIGLFINIIATIVSALVEVKRKKVAAAHNLLDDPKAIIPISVFWLLPQYILHGIGEVFMSVGHLEFLYDQSPETLRSTAAALYSLTTSLGNYIGTLVVSLVHKYTGSENNWLPDRNLNRGRLDDYYWLVTGIQAVNLVYFVTCAYFYAYKPIEEVKEEEVELRGEEKQLPLKRLNDEEGGNYTEVELAKKE
ncbi:hypothetical protein Tsubulata_028280 [Turnera subulata]|uniref:Uncharacterized protein n=1 Tax=Turnera subulata TaxID=218843 RepID=A0A9Q0J4Z4_9ROSI|nr:hypothetical protein Tsubulata_028280 [Turnera subulata]